MMLVEPSADASPEPLSAIRGEVPPHDAALLVGPEGGWAEDEWKLACARGFRLITLGHRTLRADAVSVAAISVLQFVWENP